MTINRKTRDPRPRVKLLKWGPGDRGSEDVPLPFHRLGKPKLLRETSSYSGGNRLRKHNPKTKSRAAARVSGACGRTRKSYNSYGTNCKPTRVQLNYMSLILRIHAVRRALGLCGKSKFLLDLNTITTGAVIEVPWGMRDGPGLYRIRRIIHSRSHVLGSVFWAKPYRMRRADEPFDFWTNTTSLYEYFFWREAELSKLTYRLLQRDKHRGRVKMLFGVNRSARQAERQAETLSQKVINQEKDSWKVRDTVTLAMVGLVAMVVIRRIKSPVA